MSNRSLKPKKNVKEIVKKMKIDKGIAFNYINEEDATEFLSSINNYLRTASYRKNYIKYTNGPNVGKYIGLDFAYLVELSIIDMHYRFMVQKMCSDIEHSICVQLIKDIEDNEDKDGYDVAKAFLDGHRSEIRKIASMIRLRILATFLISILLLNVIEMAIIEFKTTMIVLFGFY